MERFIFDLDGTLLTNGFKKEREYFKEVFGEDGKRFFENAFKYLDDYEHQNINYDVHRLSEHLKRETGLDINDSFVEGWIEVGKNEIDTMEEGVMETLEYLSLKGKDVIVLTNWFTKTQVARLRKSKLIDFINEVHCGDTNLKPHRTTYLCACGEYEPSDCIIIGDNIEKDYYEPIYVMKKTGKGKDDEKRVYLHDEFDEYTRRDKTVSYLK